MSKPVRKGTKEDSTGDSLAAIASLAKELADSPFMKSATTVLGIISYFSEASFEGKVLDHLEQIETQLREMDAKLSEILDIVRNIDKIIERKLAAQRKAEIVDDIKVKAEMIIGTLAKYPKLGPTDVRAKMSAPDKAALRSRAEEVVELAYKLQAWGPDAASALGQAYGVFLLAAQIAGKMTIDISDVRTRMLKHANEAHELLSKARYGLGSYCETERRVLNGAAREIVYATFPLNQGAGVGALDRCANILGDVDHGFRADDHQVQDVYFNAGGRPILGSAFPGQPFDLGIGTDRRILDPYIDHLNRRAAALKEAEAQVAFAEKAEPAARLLILVLAIPVERN